MANANVPKTAADTTLKPGELLKDRYKVMGLIKKSYVSRVYKGFDNQTKKDVAVKELLIEAFSNPTEKQEALKQFLLESKILLKLNHPNLPKFEDYFDCNGKRYMIMEYVKGDKLKTLVEKFEGFWEEEQVIKWGIELCDVIGYLHTREPNPIIFRGLCPENVIVAEDGRLKLIDFGISKIFLPQSKTLAVAKTAKLHFSPMEQYTSQTNERTDIYAIGATLYYILTKVPPIDSIERVLNSVPLPSCKKYNPHASPELEKILFRAMEVEQDNRYKSVFSMIEALNTLKVEEKKKFIEEFRPAEKKPEEIKKPAKSKEKPKKTDNKVTKKMVKEKVYRPPLFDRLLDFVINFFETVRKRRRKE